MKETFIHIKSLRFQYDQLVVLNILDARFQAGELWIIRGKSGSGKSTLAKILGSSLEANSSEIEVRFSTNSKWNPEIVVVENWYEFQNLEGDRNFFYQQRYQNYAWQDTKTVGEELSILAFDSKVSQEEVDEILDIFQMKPQWERQLIELSSGEHKKMQLIKALLKKPQFLVLDQPFSGLDVFSRESLTRHLESLVKENVSVLIFSNDEISTSIPIHEVELENGVLKSIDKSEQKIAKNQSRKAFPAFLEVGNSVKEKILDFKNVTIQYGEKNVLNQVNWIVFSGEQWLLKGPNGSGKSTLLSLVNADHPQSYANDIELFGSKRGSGESIWEIKDKIGVISPELHWYFDGEMSVSDAIASGFFSAMGVLEKLSFLQNQQLDEILNYFDLVQVRKQKLNSLSVGKQRLILLARTLVKKPKLLVFDEPCQGMDEDQIVFFNQLVDDLAEAGQTFIYVGHFESQLPKKLSHKLELHDGKVKSNEELKMFIQNSKIDCFQA